VIDLHCHVLPGIDDGPTSLAESLALAQAAQAGGTEVIVATPHVNWQWPNSARSITAGVDRVNAALGEAGIDVEVCVGAEIAMSKLPDLPEGELRALRLGGGDSLLVECPLAMVAAPIDAIVFSLHQRGYRTVLAHPERSPSMRAEPGRLEALVRAGAITSITAGSLLGQFGREVQSFSFWMLERRLVHNVTSDAHDAERRSPSLRDALGLAALEAPGLADHIDWLAHEVPQAILDGAPLPPAPTVEVTLSRRPRGRLTGLLRRSL
jgi:protein-tyrosine phosphatase